MDKFNKLLDSILIEEVDNHFNRIEGEGINILNDLYIYIFIVLFSILNL